MLKDPTPYRVTWLTKGYGSGGTYGGAIWHLLLCRLNKRSQYSWVLGPTFTQIADTLIPTFTDVLYDVFKQSEGVHYELNSSVFPRIIFKNGQEIWFKSGNRASSLVGPSISHYMMTEPGMMKKQAFDKIAARLRCPKAKILQGLGEGTPEGMNDYEKEANFPEGIDNERNYRRIILPTKANGYLQPGYIENLARKLAHDSAKLRSYTEGIFLPFTKGTAYWNFKEKPHIALDIRGQTQIPITACFDFNKSPLAWVAVQRQLIERPQRRIFKATCLHESSGKSRGLMEACAEFIVAFPPAKWRDTRIEIDGDSNGYAGSALATSCGYDQIVQFLRAYYREVVVVASRSAPTIQARLERFNSVLAYELFVTAAWNRNLIRSLSITCLKEGMWEIAKPQGEDWSHWSDAVGYYIFRTMKDEDLEQPLIRKVYGTNK